MRTQNLSRKEINRAERAIKYKAMKRGFIAIESMNWQTAFNAVEAKTRVSDFNKKVKLTKKALSNVTKKELKKQHKDYIESDKWKKRRNEKLEQENYNCERCGGSANQCHHKHYRHFNSTNKEAEIHSLMAVCRECHKQLEGVKEENISPKTTKEDFSQEENLKKYNKKYLADLKEMKEKEAEEGISNGRRRWFNREISKTEKEIKEGL